MLTLKIITLLIAIPLSSSNILLVQLAPGGSWVGTLAIWISLFIFGWKSLLHLLLNIDISALSFNAHYVITIGSWVCLSSALFHVSTGSSLVNCLINGSLIICLRVAEYCQVFFLNVTNYLVSFILYLLLSLFTLFKLCACSTQFLAYINFSKYLVKMTINNPYSVHVLLTLSISNIFISVYLQYYFLIFYFIYAFVFIMGLLTILIVLMPSVKQVYFDKKSNTDLPVYESIISVFIIFVIYLFNVIHLQGSSDLLTILATLHVITYLLLLGIISTFITFTISECCHYLTETGTNSQKHTKNIFSVSSVDLNNYVGPTVLIALHNITLMYSTPNVVKLFTRCSGKSSFVAVRYSSSYSSPFASKFDKSQFFAKVKEKDKGQDTNNRFILANRHIKEGLPPTVDIINTVLDIPSELILDEALMYKLASIKPKTFSYPASSDDQVTIRKLYGARKLKYADGESSPGAYILRREHSAYVGGALHLNNRPFTHLSPSKKGRAAQWIQKYSKIDFTIDLYSLKDIQDYPCNRPADLLVLFLEQYLTFLHRPDINGAFVANLGTTELTAERHLQIIETLGIPVYTYFKGVLIHVFRHTSRPGQLLGRGNSWTAKIIQLQKGIYRKDLFFSNTKVMYTPENLVSEDEFVIIAKELIGDSVSKTKSVRQSPLEGTEIIVTRPSDGFTRTYTNYTEASQGLKKDFDAIKGWSKTTFSDIKTKLISESVNSTVHRGLVVSIKLSSARKRGES